MTSLESWLSVLRAITVVFTLAVLAVALLRHPVRRWLGASVAFPLWAMPPLAVLATVLPHGQGMHLPALPPLIVTVTNIAHERMAASLPFSTVGTTWLPVVWLIGALLTLSFACWSQLGFLRRIRAGTSWPAAMRGLRIWQACDCSVGPAMVGMWRPRIVVPGDFAQRYDEGERRLILAHEAMHIRRGDGWWCAWAQACACIFWFHPLLWWALRAWRHDQELACDAAVLREHAGQRRRYALAMLKTQTTHAALPWGCAWSPRHPLTERIAMLQKARISRSKRVWGSTAVALLVACAGGAAYAGAGAPTSVPLTEGHYLLNLDVVSSGRADPLHIKSCLIKGQRVQLTEGDDKAIAPWQASVGVDAAEGGLLEISAEVTGGTLKEPTHPRVRTLPNQEATIMIGQQMQAQNGKPGFDHTLTLKLTPSQGC
ncbi:M56 family metallopeptidase [Dyella sp.]|uniref:M56 family metallopeptidase n=1 Tax=Dyella sp. TaxID=1869338 RepID=UPI002ED55ADF